MSAPTLVTNALGLVGDIAATIGVSFASDSEPAESAQLNADGVWEYHFVTDPAWGFVAAGPNGPIETSYPDWGPITVGAYQTCVFHENSMPAVFTPTGGTIAGGRDDGPGDVEARLLDALQTERDALGWEWATRGSRETHRCARVGISRNTSNNTPGTSTMPPVSGNPSVDAVTPISDGRG
jgi:hypothetical protein